MNHEEEQKNELEALREIYYNEIEVLSDKPPISFSIRVRTRSYAEQALGISDGDSDGQSDRDEEADEEDDGDDFVTIGFDLPPKYPDEKPKIWINATNLDEDDQNNLEASLDQTAEESRGMVMILTLVNAIDEWFTNRTKDDEPVLVQEKVEPQEQRVFDGTPVTVETFLAWKKKFEAEIAPKATAIRSDGKLTGRAMFECDKTLAESDLNFVEDLDQTEIEALMQELSHEDDIDDSEDEDVYIDSEGLDEDEEEEDDDDDDC